MNKWKVEPSFIFVGWEWDENSGEGSDKSVCCGMPGALDYTLSFNCVRRDLNMWALFFIGLLAVVLRCFVENSKEDWTFGENLGRQLPLMSDLELARSFYFVRPKMSDFLLLWFFKGSWDITKRKKNKNGRPTPQTSTLCLWVLFRIRYIHEGPILYTGLIMPSLLLNALCMHWYG